MSNLALARNYNNAHSLLRVFPEAYGFSLEEQVDPKGFHSWRLLVNSHPLEQVLNWRFE